MLNENARYGTQALYSLVLFSVSCGSGDGSTDNMGGTNPGQPSDNIVVTLPFLSGTPSGTATVGSYYTYTPKISGSTTDQIVFRVNNKPTWLSFNNTTGRLQGWPAVDDVGTLNGIEITAFNAAGSDNIGPFSITVVALPIAQKKYNPGHYISMNPWDTDADMLDALLRPGVAGLQKRYYWSWLEPNYDEYDFSAIKADLDQLAAQNKQLVVLIEDKTFNGEIPTPPYLQANYTSPNRAGGYTVIRWKPYVVERLTKLINELGKQFDSHPAFEGVAMQESEPGFEDSVLAANGYTPEIYRDALIETLLSAAQSVPTSRVFWYMNFLPNKMAYIGEIANAVAPAGVAMGGPDVLPDSYPLQTLTYPYYDQFNRTMLLFNSIQYDSYGHRHQGASYSTTYWTMDELFQFARDDLHISYLFWNRKTWAEPSDSYTWTDGLPVISGNPIFNP